MFYTLNNFFLIEKVLSRLKKKKKKQFYDKKQFFSNERVSEMDYISYLRSCISPHIYFVSLEFMFFSASLDRFISVQLKNKNTVKSENYLVIYSQIVHLLQFSQQRPL